MKGLACILMVMLRHKPNGSVQGEHDVLYFDWDIRHETLSVEDIKACEQNAPGFHWSTEADCWAMFT